MKPFHTIAVPHQDILEGRLTLDVFAADLWEVFKGRAPDEYRDADQFFQKTYQTEGLKHLLSVVERRLRGVGGDPVIQIQTPFGGGKTHALIAMYHKAQEWQAKPVVMVGTTMSPSDTLWGLLEEQVTGQRSQFTGLVSPGRDAIYNLLSGNQPALILMDEVLEYITKAAGVQVAESTLAAQTMAFMQELTEAAGTLGKVALIITLPSSVVEHYDEQAERLFAQLQKVSGRVEKIYTPVQEHEIAHVIRRRLFSQIHQDQASQVIQGFMQYAQSESLLPPGVEPSEYRRRFEASYPFLPEVIDILYQRWGSFPSFQRTRGVLRLLSLVIHALREKPLPYISLADFDLSNQEFRRELIKHIGQEYDSIIAADLTGDDSGARKVDTELGDAYKGLRLGSRATTTIFLYSFSGGTEHGATLSEVKRNATSTGHPSSVIAEAVSLLGGKLGYIRHEGNRFYFTNRPNLNTTLLTCIENLTDGEITNAEDELLRRNLAGSKLKVFVEPADSLGVPDTPDLKLVLLKKRQGAFMEQMLANRGSTPRVHRNTIFFLTPLATEAAGFYHQLHRALAYRKITGDKTLNLSDDQRKEVQAELKKAEGGLDEALRRYYRLLFIPTREGLSDLDLGIPTFGESRKLDEVVYEALRANRHILERIEPLVIKERYLREAEYIRTEQLAQSSTQSPGEPRVTNTAVWENAIRQGVQQGLLGLGELKNGQPTYRFFREPVLSVAFTGEEVVIREDVCVKQKEEKDTQRRIRNGGVKPGGGEVIADPPPEPGPEPGPQPPPQPQSHKQLQFEFDVPKGKVSGLMGIMNLLQLHFKSLHIELRAADGEMSQQDFEDKIKEAFAQLGISLGE